LQSRRETRIISKYHTNLDELMYDDYDLEYQFGNDQILDEDMYYEYHARGITSSYEYENDDDEYARDSCDYDTLAYKHYA